jgi:hypothetical protein
MRQATIGIFLSIILGALPVAAAEDISAQEGEK